jgi:hypothetical protein
MSYEIGVLGSTRKETIFISQAQGFPVKTDTPRRSETEQINAGPMETETGASVRKESATFKIIYSPISVREYPKRIESRWPNYFSMFDRVKRGEGITPLPVGERPKRSERKVSGTQDSQDTPKRKESMTYTNA